MRHFRSSALGFCFLLGSTGLTSTAFAQQATTVPFPVRQYQDENGVDLLSGAFTAASPMISIGGPQMGLNYVRQVRTGIFRDNIAWNISLSGTTYTVAIGTSSDAFTQSGTSFIPVEANGSNLTYNSATTTYTYTAADGTVATFVQRPVAFGFGNATGLSINTITYPNGKVLTYYYREDMYVNLHGQTVFGRRLQAVTSNTGYMIHPAYASDVPAANGPGGWANMTQVKALNTSVDTCSPNDLSCPEAGRPEIDISLSLPTTSYTDSLGLVTQYTTSAGAVSAIRMPGSTSDDITIAYVSGKVSSVTRFGVTTGYSFVDNTTTGVRTATVTRPGGSTRIATFDINKNVMLSDQNELGKTYSFQYDTNNRPTRVTLPEGNYTQLTYDARGNVTQLLRVPKSGSGLSNIMLTASYDTTCANIMKCNQPNFTKDGKLNQTDYTYDPTHGGVLTVTRPAPSTGAVRPQTRITYTRLGANGAPSSTGVFMPTGISECQMTASCTAAADEAKATISYGQGLLPSSVAKANGTGTLTATTAATYDVIGNLVTIDGPLTGTADTTAYRHDPDRELVGVISPDPDGAGSLPNRATRITYASTTGLITKQELGTTAGQTDTAWNAFAPLETVDITYDANRRVATRKLSSGSTAYALTQTSYDSRGRTDCVTQRMNTAVYGSLPASACTLGTSGSDGADRVVKQIYDNASHVTQVQEAVGTTDAANERTLTYTDNNLVQTLTDAENNKSTFIYDGFDRLSKTEFPSPTKGSGTSSTTDYEQLTYDANSNVISRRLRDATSIAFTFDNLNRVTLKNLPGTEPDVTYAYDNLGRPTSAAQTGNALSFTYDALSRKLTEAGTAGTTSFQYDLANRRTQTAWPAGGGTALIIDYTYLTTGDLSAIKQGATSLATLTYDNLGNRTGVSFLNGASQAFGYDPVARLASLTNSLSGTANDLSVTFAYNPASQIKSTVRTGDPYAWTGHGNGSTAFTQNGLNQQISVGGITATWDSKGNLTSEPQSGKTYGYSSENLLTSASGGTGATLTYDPALRLTQVTGTTTRRYGYDGADAILEADTNNTTLRRYVFDPTSGQPLIWWEGNGIASTSARYLSQDERGSVISVTDSGGSVLGLNTYDEYGKPGPANIGLYQYAGAKWIAEANVYDNHFRDYVPQLGMFAQTDPIGFAGDGPNLYAYTLDDPVNYVDPLGLDDQPPIIICGDCDTNVPINLVRGSAVAEPKNVYHDNYNYSPEILINGTRKFNKNLLPGPEPASVFVTCDAAGCDEGVVITGTRGQEPFVTINGGAVLDPNYRKPWWSNEFDACFVLCPPLIAGGAALASAEGAEFLFARGTGVLNNNSYLRIGYGWKGSASEGRMVFRVAIGNRAWAPIPGLPPFAWHIP